MPNILGVKVDAVSRPQALAIVDQMLRHGGQHIITTPNPEMLVAALKDKEFCEALNRAALALPDGVGLMFASWFLGAPLKERICGSDFVWDLMRLAANRGYTMYFLGGKPGVVQKAAEKLRRKVGAPTEASGLKIVGVESGPQYDEIQSLSRQRLDLHVLKLIQSAAPDILLVAFGHGKQEKWIAQHLHELPSVKVAMGVGGVFDFISGNIRRAPTLFRNLGLEWLWRLLRQPRRIKRIWNAVVVFSMLVLKEKIKRGSQVL